MSLSITVNEGRTIRQAAPPDVSVDPRYKNYVWVKEMYPAPPQVCAWDESAQAWVCPDGLTNNGVVIAQLASVVFSPLSGRSTEGFSLSHAATGVVIWYSVNGNPFQVYSGGVVFVDNPGYFFVAAYATKNGLRDSDIVIAEYLAPEY